MYIIRINTGFEQLTYTFMNESWGKGGNDGLGVSMFLSAFKKYFADDRQGVSAKVMNEHGLYYNPTTNLYVHTENWWEVTVPLNEAGKRELEEWKQNHLPVQVSALK